MQDLGDNAFKIITFDRFPEIWRNISKYRGIMRRSKNSLRLDINWCEGSNCYELQLTKKSGVPKIKSIKKKL